MDLTKDDRSWRGREGEGWGGRVEKGRGEGVCIIMDKISFVVLSGRAGGGSDRIVMGKI